ncbi:DmpA family aminopeptidase [Sinomicrobium sp.]
MIKIKWLALLSVVICTTVVSAQEGVKRGRARDFGLQTGILPTGKWNAITDVPGVKVGHRTLIEGDDVRTGVTAIIPHQGNVFQQKVPAAVYVGNGFGKSIGLSQIEELGTLETPILLTNTLSVPAVADGLLDYMLALPGNETVRSINSVVGETNDGYLNDIRSRNVTREDALQALNAAKSGPVSEGNIGAGTGTRALGFKGGIGTASRVLPPSKGGYTVGVLVQSNFGGVLSINGAPVGRELKNFYMMEKDPYVADGSCMIIIATDAPLSDRNLKRLARRSYLAFGAVGSFSSNGSGDYSIAFSTHPDTFVPYKAPKKPMTPPVLHNDDMSPLFMAVLEATEEAIYNSLFMAEDMKGFKGHIMKALPIPEVLPILKKYGALHQDSLPSASKK